MKKRLVITLTEEATEKWLELASARTEAEVNEDCEPSGSSLLVDISPIYATCSYYNAGTEVELGEVDATLVEDNHSEVNYRSKENL